MFFLSIFFSLSMLFSSSANAFILEGFKAKINLEGSFYSNPKDYGFWIVYTTTDYKIEKFWEVLHRWSSTIDALPVQILENGEFEVPDLDFGDGQYYKFYKKILNTPRASANFDRYDPQTKRISIFLVKKNDLAENRRDLALRSFEESKIAKEKFDIISQFTVQLTDCENNNTCGIDHLKQVLQNLSLASIRLEPIRIVPETSTLFIHLNPREPIAILKFKSNSFGNSIESNLIVNRFHPRKLESYESLAMTILTGSESISVSGEISFFVTNEALSKITYELPGISEYWVQPKTFEFDGMSGGKMFKRKNGKKFTLEVTPTDNPLTKDLTSIPMMLHLLNSNERN